MLLEVGASCSGKVLQLGFWVRCARAVAGCCVILLLGASADAPQSFGERKTRSWLSAVDSVTRRGSEGTSGDYDEAFVRVDEWSKALESLAVFKTSTQFLLGASDLELRAVFSTLQAHHVRLAVEALMIPRRAECGHGIEGYSAPGDIARVAKRVKSLGGELSFAAMDEPLWFGHHYLGPNACEDSVQHVAQQVAQNVQALREIFPEIQVGDIEPIGSRAAPADWPQEIMAFADAYRAATGTPLAFFHADIDWHRDWRTVLAALIPRLRQEDIRLGIIYNGDPMDGSDLAWARHAEERFETIEADSALRPDDAVLQSWMRYPKHLLPEDQPGTMTNLVLRYARAQPSLLVDRNRMHIDGRLSGAEDRPLSGASIQLTVMNADGGRYPMPRAIVGVVPDGAVAALVAIRANTECDCTGSGDLTFGLAQYRDGGGDRPVEGPLMPTGADHVHIGPGVALARTGRSFPVAAGSDFAFDIPLDSSASLQYGGYAAIIFLNESGKEFRRLVVDFSPSERPVATVVTDAAGHFSADLPTKTSASAIIKAHFPGNDAVRGISVVAH